MLSVSLMLLHRLVWNLALLFLVLMNRVLLIGFVPEVRIRMARSLTAKREQRPLDHVHP